MKPGFALILSPDGISLLLRANQGWRVVGDVPITSADLGAELQQLRKTAAGLRAGGVACKLVLPDSQILYTKISAPGPSEAERLVQIRRGLDGLTPYSVDELAFDWRIDGDNVNVAAVAQETITEAEEFALEHRFNPVSFVGMPQAEQFNGEPFFGAAPSLHDWLEKDDPLEHDVECIHVLGAVSAHAPSAPTQDDPAKDDPNKTQIPQPAPPKHAEPPLVLSPGQNGLEDQQVTPPGPDILTPAAIPAAIPAAMPAVLPAVLPAKTPLETPADVQVSQLTPKKPPAPTDGQKTESPTWGTDGGAPDDKTGALPLPAFTSARKNPPVAKAKTSPQTASKNTGQKTGQTLAKTPTTSGAETNQAPPLGSALSQQTPRFTFGQKSSATAEQSATKKSALKNAAPRSEPTSTGKHNDLIDVQAAAASLNPGFSENPPPAVTKTLRKLRRPKKAAPKPPAKKTPVLSKAVPSGYLTADSPKAMAMPAPAPLQPSSGRNEADSFTVFGARTPPPDTRSAARMPKRRWIIAAAATGMLAVVLIGGMLVFSKSTPQVVQTGDQQDVTPPVATATTTPVNTPVNAVDTLQAQDQSGDITAPPLDQTDPAFQAVELSDDVGLMGQPSEVTAGFGTSGFDTASLDLDTPDIPQSLQNSPPAISQLGDEDVLTPDPVATETVTTDDAPSIDRNSTGPVTLLERAPQSLTTAPGQLAAPLSGETTSLYIASIDQASPSHDAVALPTMDIFATDFALVARLNPAPADSQFILDTDGLVTPSPDGTLNPDGIRIFAGPPPSAPALRIVPDSPDLVSEVEEKAAALARKRPKTRPDDLLETNERFRLGGRSKAQLAALKPRLRPQSQQQAASPATTAPTALATATSPQPKARPGNFAAIVAASRAQEPEKAPLTAVSAPQSVTPNIPSSASVARQATVENALNLRKINLIGVYGSPSNRRALIRLSSGRYVKVKVGDRVDGGKVAAIDQSELRYVKSGRNITLKMPKS